LTCTATKAGATRKAFVAKKVFATKQQDEAMIVASMTAYCPQYLPQLHA
jgi:hypothetical protein